MPRESKVLACMAHFVAVHPSGMLIWSAGDPSCTIASGQDPGERPAEASPWKPSRNVYGVKSSNARSSVYGCPAVSELHALAGVGEAMQCCHAFFKRSRAYDAGDDC